MKLTVTDASPANPGPFTTTAVPPTPLLEDRLSDGVARSAKLRSKASEPTVTTAGMLAAALPSKGGTVKVHAPTSPSPGSDPVPSVVQPESVTDSPFSRKATGWFSVAMPVRSWMSSVSVWPA